MKDIMIATSNPNKVREYREMLEPLGYRIHDLSEIEHQDPEENGKTFAENALIKAGSVWHHTGMTAIADDSGLSIDHLKGQPGIHSARYLAGHDYTYKNKMILRRLKKAEDRSARFTCAIALIDEKGEHVFEGVMEGSISREIRGTNGFGYDPIFIPEGMDRTSAELLPEEKNAISHRGQATRKLLAYLNGEGE
ncbi:MAG: RdgB/HAM1 family non-canonical purine NTP pyrophosphatase [Erysipelotrichaceae bacterium]|nr:RdgB/HAM1 family non-canonical purine NTP pyrophosphatase [Erysipelotrichaceae bacterium]MBO4537500.1 RdgB/HAM1 family non-canonical purine NTP pyrophosphatase [Erysipelotrichaceae bacterium]MBR5048187.1 RdgB/HAM1 family non-canonical purine NTP pyrophosphatase [Erysipelotrichaceae bacterium]